MAAEEIAGRPHAKAHPDLTESQITLFLLRERREAAEAA